MKKYLVTGASGFIGQNLCNALKEKNHEVVAWGRSHVAMRPVDMLDYDQVRTAIELERPDGIFHLAATGVSHQTANDADLVDSNTCMLNHLYQALGELGVESKIVTAGSMAEYGQQDVPLTEDLACQPTTKYAEAKLACTHLSLRNAKQYSIPTVATRIFGAYGFGEKGSRLFPSLIRDLSNGEPVDLSDGMQRRDFVHIDDVTAAFQELIECPQAHGQIVNIGTGHALQVRQICEWFADELGVDRSLLRFGARGRVPNDADFIQADVSRLEQLLHWTPPQRLCGTSSVEDLFGSQVE